MLFSSAGPLKFCLCRISSMFLLSPDVLTCPRNLILVLLLITVSNLKSYERQHSDYRRYMQVLQERGESTSRHGRASFSVLLFQVYVLKSLLFFEVLIHFFPLWFLFFYISLLFQWVLSILTILPISFPILLISSFLLPCRI